MTLTVRLLLFLLIGALGLAGCLWLLLMDQTRLNAELRAERDRLTRQLWGPE